MVSVGGGAGLESGWAEALRFFDERVSVGGESAGSAARLAAERVTLDDMSVGH